MKNQREATVFVILATLAARDFEYELNGEEIMGDVLTDADKTSIREQLFIDFREGEISYKSEFQASIDDDAALKKYISGLLNNWIRKAKEFNCGNAYVAKNPGSRAHASDERMRELKKLLAELTAAGDTDAIAEVKEAIEFRKTEIKPKTALKPIVVGALPEHLRHLVQSIEETTTEEEVIEE